MPDRAKPLTRLKLTNWLIGPAPVFTETEAPDGGHADMSLEAFYQSVLHRGHDYSLYRYE
jgi:hypothetical protein